MTETEMLRAQVDSLTKQLTAATNDAARAELRAQELAATLRRVKKVVDWDGGEFEHRIDQILAAAPDSDARLREVMLKVAHGGARAYSNTFGTGQSLSTALRNVVNEVLREKP